MALWRWITHFQIPMATYIYAVDSYGEGLFLAVEGLASQQGQKRRINGVGIRYMPTNYNTEEARDALRTAKSLGCKCLLLSMTADQSSNLFPVMRDEGMLSSSWQLLGSEAIGVIDGQQGFTKQDIPVGFMQFYPVSRGSKFAEFEHFWTKLRAEDVIGTAASSRYNLGRMRVALDAGKAQKLDDSFFTDTKSLKLEDPFIFDAAFTFVIAANSLLNRGKRLSEIGGEVLLEEVYKTSFEGISGNVSFNEAGDRLASYELLNMQPGLSLVVAGLFSTITKQITFVGSQPLYWMDGVATPQAPHALVHCGPGFFQENLTGQCLPCQKGYFCLGGESAIHTLCGKGTFANATGSSTCQPCSPGRYAGELGGFDCTLCEPGRFASDKGQSTCADCPRGQLSGQGFTQCMSCPGDLTTNESRQSSADRDCLCSAGTYRDKVDRLRCHECPPNMICEFGSDQAISLSRHTKAANTAPRIKSGSMVADVDGRLHTFVCRTCLHEQPLFTASGELQSLRSMCGNTFEGLSCGQCVQGYYLLQRSCRRCDRSPDVILLSMLVVLVFACLVLYHSSMYPPSAVLVANMSIVGFIQTITVLSRYGMSWPGILRNLQFHLAFFELDLSMIDLPRECLLGSSFAPRYAFQAFWMLWLWLGFGILFVASAMVTHVGKRVGPHITGCMDPQTGRCLDRALSRLARRCEASASTPLCTVDWYFPINRSDLINAAVKTHSGFFIIIMSSCLAILRVEINPSGLGTLDAYPEVLFGSDEWWLAVPPAIVALLLLGVGFFVFYLYIVLMAPRQVSASPNFRRSYRGLWAKYDPQAYWFGIVAILYSLLLNMCPAVIRQSSWQAVLAVLINATYILACGYVRPWKFTLNNFSDLASKMGLTCIILILNTSQTNAEPIDTDVASAWVISISGVFVLLIYAAVLRQIYFAELNKVAEFSRRIEFAQRLSDIALIAGSKGLKDTRDYALTLNDNDVRRIEAALDVLQFTIVGLQSPSRRLWRLSDVPFEVAVPGRIQGELMARNLLDAHDARVELQCLKDTLDFYSTQKDGKRDISKLLNTFDTNQNGTLDEKEFVDGFLLKLESFGINHINREALKKIFQFANVDGNGELSLTEFRHAMNDFPEPILPDWHREMQPARRNVVVPNSIMKRAIYASAEQDILI
eukprot:TRINITY_DN18371_c0_g3_i1.p1 TRINITY_DN18371_c0_g3~~TRINITY_DN18371_c0_g3_i1.p1  ORF type:complete len:1350 (+),score=150.42 TRINITY_DN18371_c0_g3_i1:569-4051(+)